MFIYIFKSGIKLYGYSEYLSLILLIITFSLINLDFSTGIKLCLLLEDEIIFFYNLLVVILIV